MVTIPQGNPDSLRVFCPRCKKKTDRIQAYDLPVVLFLFGSFTYKRQRVFGCPSCVRKTVFGHLLMSIPMTNLLCWIFVPWHLLLLAFTYAEDRPGIPPEYRSLTEVTSEMLTVPEWQGTSRGRGLRIFLVLLVLAVVVGVLLFVLPQFTQR